MTRFKDERERMKSQPPPEPEMRVVYVDINGERIEGDLIEDVSPPTGDELFWVISLKNGNDILASHTQNVMVEFEPVTRPVEVNRDNVTEIKKKEGA